VCGCQTRLEHQRAAAGSHCSTMCGAAENQPVTTSRRHGLVVHAMVLPPAATSATCRQGTSPASGPASSSPVPADVSLSRQRTKACAQLYGESSAGQSAAWITAVLPNCQPCAATALQILAGQRMLPSLDSTQHRESSVINMCIVRCWILVTTAWILVTTGEHRHKPAVTEPMCARCRIAWGLQLSFDAHKHLRWSG
jgi:hypothetical protein